jgi:WD40 repeat protein
MVNPLKGAEPSASETDQTQVKEWITQLGNEDYSVRDQAYADLLGWAKGHTAQAHQWVPMRHVDPEIGDRLYKLWGVLQNNPYPGQMEDNEMVFAVAYSPDGKMLASCAGHEIKLWDMESYRDMQRGDLIRTFEGHASKVKSVAFSPDGKRLVSGAKEAILWNTETGEPIRTLVEVDWGPMLPRWGGFAPGIGWRVAFSPDGRHVAVWGLPETVGQDGEGKDVFRVWETETGKRADTSLAQVDKRDELASGPGGRWVALANVNDKKQVVEGNLLKQLFLGRRMYIRDVWTGESLAEWPAAQEFFSLAVALSADGKLLALGGMDGVQLWEIEGGEMQWHKRLDYPNGRYGGTVSVLAFAGDRKDLLVSAGMGGVLLLDVQTGEPRWRNTFGDEALTAVFSPDEAWIAAGCRDRRIRIIERATGKVLGEETVVGGVEAIRTIPGSGEHVQEVIYSPDGRYLASAAGPRVVLREVKTGEEVRTFTDEEVAQFHEGNKWYMDLAIISVAFSPDGKLLAAGSVNQLTLVWEVETGKLLHKLKGHLNLVFAVAFSPDGKRLASGSWSGQTLVWDLETGELIQDLRSKRGIGEHSSKPNINQIVFSKDGKKIATASFDGSVRIFSTETWEEEQALLEHHDMLFTLAFSPDGKQIATAGRDRQIMVWDAESGKRQHLISTQTGDGHLRGMISSVTFSPDGKQLLSAGGDSTIRMWDPATGQQQRVYAGYGGGRVAYSPDGKTFVSGGAGGAIQVWEAQPEE